MKKLYMVLPAFFKTGGTELGHQLVKTVLNFKVGGVEAKVAYKNTEKGKAPLNPAFSEYINDWVAFEDIEDDSESIIVFPEIYIDCIPSYQNAICGIWWMSVDNYWNQTSFKRDLLHQYQTYGGKLNSFLHATKGLFGFHHKMRRNVKKVKFHLYQSEYARQFLIEKKLSPAYPLSDYINDLYLNSTFNLENREDIVLYNPKKGFDFTKKIIEKAPDLHWAAIKDMTNDEVFDLLNKSKVYIDFGNHPGKDRFPREAAMSGCCVITGKRGAAQNLIDINIPEKYKFEDKEDNIDAIISQIRDILCNYNSKIDDFQNYRRQIAGEKKQFEEDAAKFIREFIIDGFETPTR